MKQINQIVLISRLSNETVLIMGDKDSSRDVVS